MQKIGYCRPMKVKEMRRHLKNGQFLKLIMSVGEWQERRKQRAKSYAKLYH